MSESWGAPTWIFFHTICEKIKQDNNNIFTELVSNIALICQNLPCPICTNHAIQYMKINKTNNIRTKDELRMYLFNFHNNVNKNKNKPLFQIEKLNKYKNENMTQVFNKFYYNFFNSSSTLSMNKIYVNKYMLAQFHKWLLKNQHCFDM